MPAGLRRRHGLVARRVSELRGARIAMLAGLSLPSPLSRTRAGGTGSGREVPLLELGHAPVRVVPHDPFVRPGVQIGGERVEVAGRVGQLLAAFMPDLS